MSTRNVVLSEEDRLLLIALTAEAKARAEEAKLLTRPDSPEEGRAVSAQVRFEYLLEKLL